MDSEIKSLPLNYYSASTLNTITIILKTHKWKESSKGWRAYFGSESPYVQSLAPHSHQIQQEVDFQHCQGVAPNPKYKITKYSLPKCTKEDTIKKV